MTEDAMTAREGAGVIRVGDHVRLRVGGEVMLVIAVRTVCDGTGGDGDGLYCEWWEDDKRIQGWVSESSVEMCEADD